MREFLRRLSPNHDPAPAAERAGLPRWIGLLAVPACLVTLVWLLGPHSDRVDERAAAGCMVAAAVFGLLFRDLASRSTPASVAALMAADTVLIGIGVVVSQAPLSPVPLFFVWVVPFGFALFSLWHALLQAALLSLTYAVALCMVPAPAGVSGFAAWAALTTTVLVSGLGIRRVMGRVREMDQRYRSSFAEAATGMALVTPQSRYLEVNDAFCELVGRPADVLLGTSPIQWTVPQDVPATLEFFANSPEGERLDRRFLRPDGSVVWGRLTRSPVRDPRGRILYYVHQVEDITASRSAEAAIARRARLSDVTAAIGRLAVDVTDSGQLADQVADMVAECLGVDGCSVLEALPDGRSMRVLASSRASAGRDVGQIVLPEARALSGLSLASHEAVAVEDVQNDPRLDQSVVLRESGLTGALSCTLRRQGEILGIIGAFTRERRTWEPEERQFLGLVATMLAAALARSRSEAEARRRALHDPLTGLPNRELFRDRLAGALARMRRGGPPPAVLLLDLDGFKVVNDSLGHHAGDELLRCIAPRLAEAVRAGDTVARLGGDEFVVLADGVQDESTAMLLAQRLEAAWREPVRIGEAELHLSASVGVAVATPACDPDSLLRDADAAMYHAKRRGRGRFELFGAPLRDEALRRLALEQDLRRALEPEELHLEYQPVIDFDTNAVVSYEALLRWTHPERGSIGPDEFIGIAEDSGLMLPMGRWVLQTACAEAQRWPAGVGIGVNLSARQVADPDLCEHVRGALAVTGLDPSRLTLEITESTLMEEAEAPLRTLEELRAMGVRLALDDFGTGYSSLSYLRRFALDTLKVDRSFVRDLGSDPHATPLVEAVVSMAGALGLAVVAEGVETEAQRAQLAALGCRYGQGYLLGRPEPAAALHRPGGAATIPA